MIQGLLNAPRLSVLLCNYNDSALLPRALEGFFSQTAPPDEVVVVDDGSTDQSVALLEAAAARHPELRLVRNERNLGVSGATARGLEHARGEHIYFAACDHRLKPGFFKAALDALARHPEAGFCQTDYESLDGQAYNFHLSDGPAYFSPGEAAALCRRIGYWPGSGCSQILRRAAVLEAGGIQPELRGLLDVWMSLVIAARRGFCYVPGSYMAVDRRPGAYSHRLRRWSEQRFIGRFLFRLLDSEDYRDVRDWIRRAGVWPPLQPWLICALMGEPRRWRFLSLRTLRQAAADTAKTYLAGRLSLRSLRALASARDAWRRLLKP